MWSSRFGRIRSNIFIKQYSTPRCPISNSSTLNRSLWTMHNNRSKTFLSALASRLIRAFDRNLKSIFKIGRSTRSAVFGNLLENRLIQVMLIDFGRSFSKNRDMMFGAACLSVYNWEKNSAHDEHIDELVKDVDFISHLTLETLTCQSCRKRLKIDQKVPDVVYCTCSESKPLSQDVDGWKPFIERPNTLVWRKEHEQYKGLYAYKMYVYLERVTAMDFLRVQIDTEFRKQWDSSATQLKIIEENQETNSDLVYWEMRWPRPFANRDYVFERKLMYIPKENLCVVSSLASSHPTIPVNKSIHRVTEYWSFMVVKPFTDFEKPGMEFVLTYFDNPGLSIPSSVSSWVAMTGLPNFVGKLQDAAGKVADIVGPEPTLLRCLRLQLEEHRKSVTTIIKEDLFEVQLPSRGDTNSSGEESISVQEENRLVSIVEDDSSRVKGNDDGTPSSTSGSDCSTPSSVSPDSSDSSLKLTSAPSSNGTTSVNSSNENAQFLSRNPVFA